MNIYIGLTYTGAEAKQENYRRWLQQAGSNIHIVTLSARPEENEGSLDNCHALVLTGGIDIHPAYYNNSNLAYAGNPGQFDEDRDAFETALFRAAQAGKIPVLGICRGMELINCILGGTLQQDLDWKNSIHRAAITEAGQQLDKAHAVSLMPRSLLGSALPGARHMVNSAHHQCIAEIAGSLMPAALSDDAMVEALEWADKNNRPFLLGVQWHPERMYEFGMEDVSLSAGIRNLFITAIKNSTPGI